MVTKKPTDVQDQDQDQDQNQKQGPQTGQQPGPQEAQQVHRPDPSDAAAHKEEGRLEKLGRLIDPLARDISDDEIFDPGANTPAPRRRPRPKAPDTK